MEKYPVLSLIIRGGTKAAVGAAIVVAALILWLAWSSHGWAGLVPALLGGGITFVLAKSYVELVVLVTDMLMPH